MAPPSVTPPHHVLPRAAPAVARADPELIKDLMLVKKVHLACVQGEVANVLHIYHEMFCSVNRQMVI
jgi:hypothetical protein